MAEERRCRRFAAGSVGAALWVFLGSHAAAADPSPPSPAPPAPISGTPAAPAAAVSASAAAPVNDEYEEPEFIRQKPVLPASESAKDVRRLSLGEALQLAARNNLGVVLVKQQLSVSEQAIAQSLGQFEPALNASFLHQYANTPPSTALEGGATQLLETTGDQASIGYAQRIRFGTQLSLQWSNNRAQSNFDTALLPLIYRSQFSLTLTQPLLKGFAFRWEVPNADVLRAQFATDRARQEVVVSLLGTVRDTEQAYWDLVQALKSYEVQQGSLEAAREQLDLTQRQIEAGILPPSDLLNAEGTLAQRELTLVQADAGIDQAADQLRQLLNLPRESWSQPILPLDAPEYDELHVTFEAALERALQHRPELRQLELDLEKAGLDVRVAETERLPQLDASVSYGLIGQRTGLGDTLSQMFSTDASAWSAGVNLTWTPLNRAAKAKLEGLRLNHDALHTLREQALLALRLELRTAIRGLDTAQRSVRAAAKFRLLAERSLDAEQRKFMNGTSSNFFIAQRQSDLAQAKLAELTALIGHRKAATALRAAMGVLLDDRRVRLEVSGE
jgi:outer membrane protein